MKEFNDTGTCIPEMHYMADTTKKLNGAMSFIEKGKYFIINRPRQYGKTTTLYMLERTLDKNEEYLVISISFEGIGDVIFEEEESFSKGFSEIAADSLVFNHEELSEFFEHEKDNVKNLKDLSRVITKFIVRVNKRVILMIDEVDKSSNNQLFISFLGMLRNKYLLRNTGKDKTFHSVILAGVHDVKSLKLKIRPESEQKFNSPWNIASDFDVDMSFSAEEIGTMLKQYKEETSVELDEEYFSERLYFYTSGYPFLVSKLCKIIDEKILVDSKVWDKSYIDKAVNILIKTSNTNFDSLIKNIENNKDVKELVRKIVLDGAIVTYNQDNPTILVGITYGIFKNSDNHLKIHNRVYEQRIYEYMSSLVEVSTNVGDYANHKSYIKENGKLDVEKILIKFKDFMKHEYSEKREKFLEHDGRLLFLAFLSPIINGTGFAFKEVQGGEEKKFDIVITYANEMHVIELKRWYGGKSNKKGEEQLNGYLEQYGLDRGYLLTFDFRKVRRNIEPVVKDILGKRIFEVVV